MINSTKVTERKKNIDALYTLLENPDLLQILNKNENVHKWDILIESIHNYLIKVGFLLMLFSLNDCTN